MRQCQHCGKRQGWLRPRGLCGPCYATVRHLYPLLASKFNRRGVCNFHGPAPLPVPTSTPPGEEKVPILEDRAAGGLALFHPLDARACLA